MAYADRLERFTHWYVQLWGESLGKNGKGPRRSGPRPGRSAFPGAIVPRRPRDKLFTVVTVVPPGLGRAWTANSPSSPANPILR